MIGGLCVLFPILESQVLNENEHLGLLSLDHTNTEVSLDFDDVSSLRSYSLGMQLNYLVFLKNIFLVINYKHYLFI